MEQYIEATISTGEFSVTNEGNGFRIYLAFETDGYIVDADGEELWFEGFMDAYLKFKE